jgi:hypothetical protein
MLVGCGPFVIQVQWLCGIESRSVGCTRTVAVYLWILVCEWYISSSCVVVDRGLCLVQEQLLNSSVLWFVFTTRAVAVR